jgi:hypothetical protein
MMRRLLEDVRANLGGPPRILEDDQVIELTPTVPPWFRAGDPLTEIYDRLDLLLLEGRVVWGALVQANSLLFEAGPNDHPAMTIYAPDESFDDRPQDLKAIASRLFRLKNTTPQDRDERRLAAAITNEMERGMGWMVPRSLTGGCEVLSTGFMVFRRHIPGRRLQSGWFPLLIHDDTPAVMIVPRDFWPRELAIRWSAQR